MITRLLMMAILCAGLGFGPAFADETSRLMRKVQRYFEPLPQQMPGAEMDTAERVALGKQLFFDPRLSVNDAQSCASCHVLEDGKAGMDGLATSPGAEGQMGRRNSPTVLNAGWQTSQFWDGRAKDLADQARQPILNPDEMAMPSEQAVVDKLNSIAKYREGFAQAFPGAQSALTYANMAEAIAAFERTLTSEARFDDFLNGDAAALTEQEQNGLATFVRVNCVRCHDGPLLGGTLLETLGIKKSFHSQEDQGRFEVTGEERDRMIFKVAQLRNVSLTGPWFHDGSGESLEEVVRIMGDIQLGVELKDEEVADIVAFLGSLAGKELTAKP
jgi:cytochrome c peroxidase